MALWDALDGETNRAFQAFKIYLRLGNGRTYKKVQEQLGHKNATTIQGWASQYRWQERIRAYEENDLESTETKKMTIMQNNQKQILFDAFVDYNKLLDLWRIFVDNLTSNPDITASDVKKAIESRMINDNMGRRVAGLPSVIKSEEEEKLPELPSNRQAILPGGISAATIEEEFTTTDDEHYDDEE